MSRSRQAGRRPAGPPSEARIVSDPDLIASHLEDAAHFPGGHAGQLAAPASEVEVADLLRSAPAVLAIGAQSSLTGGATPMGELVLDTSRLSGIELAGPDRVRVGAGVTLDALDRELATSGRCYPPLPTYTGACVGGVIATNAAGAATFKYGSTRDWVEALTVVLPDGAVLDLERGAVHAGPSGVFEIELPGRLLRVPVPRYTMPGVPKVSAGYFAKPGMDLIDLFIGSEGTLGIVTAATLRVLTVRPAICLALVPLGSRAAALALVRALRAAAREAWRSGGARGVDVAGIEHLDRRSLELVREDGVDRLQRVRLPAGAAMALLITIELPPGTGPERAFDEIGRAREGAAPDSALVRFCRMLDEAGLLDEVEIAVPGDATRAAQLLAVREAVPAAVNLRVGRAKQSIDPRIEKIAADTIVPVDRLEELLDLCDEEFRRRGLDGAVWGHISDGNVHPNVIPRSPADVEAGKAAVLALGRAALRLGGSPLAEHGVGRNTVKQQLLREMYGDEGIEAMRAVKRAIDPGWKLAPGVLLPR